MALTINHNLNSILSTSQVLTVGATGALLIAKGSSAQRPGTPQTGMLRYNTDNNIMEFYGSGGWTNISDGTGGGGGDPSAAIAFAIVFGG